MNKEILKAFTLKKGGGFNDNSCYINADTKENIIRELKKIGMSNELICFFDEFSGVSIVTKIDKNHFQSFDVLMPNELTNKEILIGKISCYGQRLNIVYSEENECFQYENGQYISKDIQGLFEYLLSDESIQPINILPQTYNILKTAGWYEGRNIDVSKVVDKFKKDGTSLTDVQIAFLQEFGGIKGKSENRECFEIFIDAEDYQFKKSKPPTKEDMYSYGSLNVTGYEEKIDFLLVGAYGNFMVNLWISSDGRMFSDLGEQLGRTIMEGWQKIVLD